MLQKDKSGLISDKSIVRRRLHRSSL